MNIAHHKIWQTDMPHMWGGVRIMNKDYLKIATTSYYYKPYAAMINAFTLNAYSKVDITLDGDTLDLGCNDGVFDDMLMALSDDNIKIMGLEYSYELTLKAKNNYSNNYSLLITGDGTKLPINDEQLSVVISNMVLAGIENTYDVVSEIYRVLRANGKLICTFRTESFRKNYLISRILEAFYLNALAETYRDKIDQRTTAIHVNRTIEEWSKIFEQGGFEVNMIVGIFPNSLVGIWDVLALKIFRVFGVLKLLSIRRLSSISSRLQYHVFKRLYSKHKDNVSLYDASFVLFSLTKK